ncbi:threonine/serine exporter family protein, partial [Kitasatospora indigofera]|uniref:threonine/serine ThrE exporter family protein n=1 Tax=Kitasatospora indigofera TaxID=67307 RepID=UPI0036AB9400
NNPAAPPRNLHGGRAGAAPATARGAAPQRRTAHVLGLALDVGELLLADGQGTEDVEAAMLTIADTFGLADCEPQATFTMLSISHRPSQDESAMILDRTVWRRASNYTRLSATYTFVGDVADGRLGLEQARRRLAAIRRRTAPYPGWLTSLVAGSLAASATVLVGGRADAKAALTFTAAFVASFIGDRLAGLFHDRGIPEFYQYVVAAAPASVTGVVLALAGAGLRGSQVITGGLFALLPGRALVAAVQDGLTGFYLTAAARLIELLYLITGVILGVLAVLPIGQLLGATLRPEDPLERSTAPGLQLLAAAGLTISLAILLQTPRYTLLFVTLNGAVAWTVFAVLTRQADVSPIAATGVAAATSAMLAHTASRQRRLQPLPHISAALGPLLPGSLTYTGVLAFIQGRPADGLGDLSRAAAIALALAIGVSAGGEITRQLRRVPALGRQAAERTHGY